MTRRHLTEPAIWAAPMTDDNDDRIVHDLPIYLHTGNDEEEGEYPTAIEALTNHPPVNVAIDLVILRFALNRRARYARDNLHKAQEAADREYAVYWRGYLDAIEYTRDTYTHLAADRDEPGGAPPTTNQPPPDPGGHT